MNGKRDTWINSIELGKYYEALKGLSNAKDSDIALYHYTSTKVLNAILSKGAFRASNIFYLNDKIEYKMGIEVLKNIFKDRELLLGYIEKISNLNGRDWAGIYSISFSNKEDELQQWITYARESGVCIELNSKIIWDENCNKLQLGIKGGENSYLYYKSDCFLKLAYEKVNLSSAEKLAQLDANRIRYAFAKAILLYEKSEVGVLDEECIQKKWEEKPLAAQNFFKLLSVYYKEEKFKGEGEIRAAFLPAEKSCNIKSKIEYFEQQNGILRPYMDVFFMHNYSDGNPYKIECPIKSITIGPGGSQETVFQSVIHRMEYGDIKVWRYTVGELTELLQEYVFGCFKKFESQIEDSWYRKIAEIIIEEWCQKAGYGYKLEEATKISVKLILKEKEEITKRESAKDDEKIKHIVKKYCENNYFSTTGIWIKRSTLSYIF